MGFEHLRQGRRGRGNTDVEMPLLESDAPGLVPVLRPEIILGLRPEGEATLREELHGRLRCGTAEAFVAKAGMRLSREVDLAIRRFADQPDDRVTVRQPPFENIRIRRATFPNEATGPLDTTIGRPDRCRDLDRACLGHGSAPRKGRELCPVCPLGVNRGDARQRHILAPRCLIEQDPSSAESMARRRSFSPVKVMRSRRAAVRAVRSAGSSTTDPVSTAEAIRSSHSA